MKFCPLSFWMNFEKSSKDVQFYNSKKAGLPASSWTSSPSQPSSELQPLNNCLHLNLFLLSFHASSHIFLSNWAYYYSFCSCSHSLCFLSLVSFSSCNRHQNGMWLSFQALHASTHLRVCPAKWMHWAFDFWVV